MAIKDHVQFYEGANDTASNEKVTNVEDDRFADANSLENITVRSVNVDIDQDIDFKNGTLDLAGVQKRLNKNKQVSITDTDKKKIITTWYGGGKLDQVTVEYIKIVPSRAKSVHLLGAKYIKNDAPDAVLFA